MQTPAARLAALPLLVGLGLMMASGCTSTSTHATNSSTSALPSYLSEPVTPRQRLISRGAQLIVADGCAACHLPEVGQAIGPDFDHFAGDTVVLADGRRVLVNEHFLREALINRDESPIAGYQRAPMIRALRRLHLGREPASVAALAAFIEQIGPEAAS